MKVFNSAIKVFSLGLGMAIGLVIIAQVCFQLAYDRHIPDVENVYMIRTEFDQQGTVRDFPNISGAIAPGFKAEVPGVAEATRFTGLFESLRYFDEDKKMVVAEKDLLLVDSCFFKIFDRPFLSGNPQEALRSWSGAVAVSRSFAEKLGGVTEAVGQTVVNEERPDLLFNIVGVYEDFPENSTVKVDIVSCIEAMRRESIENWMGNDRYNGFVKLEPGVDPSSLAPAIRQMQLLHQPVEEFELTGNSVKYYLTPMKSFHTSTPLVRNLVLILSVIAFLLLLISLLNYLLLAFTEVIKRSREVGVRKCYGAGSRHIYLMLFKESGLNVILSLVVSAAVILGLRNLIESLTRAKLTDMLIPQTWWAVGLTVSVILLVSALIPARLYERIPISSAFRGYKETRRKWKKALLTFQFTANVFMLIMLLVGTLQYQKVTTEDVGYDAENLVYIELGGTPASSIPSILDRMNNLAFVEGAAATYTLPMSSALGNNVYFPGDTKQLFNIADQYEATEGFHALMGFRLIEGDYPKTKDDVLVSQSFLVQMSQFADWSDGAVGKAVCISEHSEVTETDVKAFTICGVVEDVRIGDALSNDSRPAVWFLGEPENDYMKTLAIRLTDVNQKNIEDISAVIGELGNELDVSVKVYSETMRNMYVFQKNIRNTFLAGALAALLIAFIGLLGFLGDETNRRSAEIAVRKVNGALSSEIVRMFLNDILKLALIAIVIGDVAGWYVVHFWLQQFADKVDMRAWHFISADLIFLGITAAIVALSSLKVSLSNPSEALKKD